MTDKQLNWSQIDKIRSNMQASSSLLLSREIRIKNHIAADASGLNDYTMAMGDNDNVIPRSDYAMPSIDGNVSFRTTNIAAIEDVTLRLAKDPNYLELENAYILNQYKYSTYKKALSKKYDSSPEVNSEKKPDSQEEETQVLLEGRLINVQPEEKIALKEFAYLSKEYSDTKKLYIKAFTAGSGLNDNDSLNVERALNFTVASQEELLNGPSPTRDLKQNNRRKER